MSRHRFLIANADPMSRRRLRAMLARSGRLVREAASGWELMSLLATDGPFALVIADVELAMPNGLQALAMARTAGLDVPFVITSPSDDPRIQTMARRLGAALLLRPHPPRPPRCCGRPRRSNWRPAPAC